MSFNMLGAGNPASMFNFSALANDQSWYPQMDSSSAAMAAPIDFSSFDTSGLTGMSGGGIPGVGLPSGVDFGGGSGGMGLGFNVPTAQLALAGLSTLGNLWGGWQAQKMAKKQFKFSKGMSLANMANQVKSYNTALADRARSRQVMESQSDATRDSYVKDNSLTAYRG
jgi:hypothetical protein